MVTEITQHPAGIIEAGRADVANRVMSIKFTRLKKSEQHHFACPSNFNNVSTTLALKNYPANLKQTVLLMRRTLPVFLQRSKPVMLLG